MSRLPKWMRPSFGGVMPDRMLRNVVLPAPFGPMSARRSPSATLSEISLRTERPPKCFATPVALIAVELERDTEGLCNATAASGCLAASFGEAVSADDAKAGAAVRHQRKNRCGLSAT